MENNKKFSPYYKRKNNRLKVKVRFRWKDDRYCQNHMIYIKNSILNLNKEKIFLNKNKLEFKSITLNQH